jgi:arsenate reductase
MAAFVLYHNPRCSKSRAGLSLLREAGIDVDVVEYLTTPLGRASLEAIVDHLEGAEPAALVRAGDAKERYGLDAAAHGTRDAVVALLAEHGDLMERPVLVDVATGAAAIGRPPEALLGFVEKVSGPAGPDAPG